MAAEPDVGRTFDTAARARTIFDRARRDEGARWTFWAMMAVTVVVLFVAGRHQWFIRDDWALLITRARVRQHLGIGQWLFSPQDGHWLTVPVLIYRFLQIVFGLASYWPFLLTAMIPHLATVVLVRILCRRVGVSEWTTTAVCAILLVFGSGWENILFAVQVSYNLSLLGFLAQILLADHDGRVGRRDLIGLLCGAVGMMSSGFGPFFIVGAALFLVLRRRYAAAALAAIPLATGYAVWWLVFGADPAAATHAGGRSQVAGYALHGLDATFAGLTVVAGLGGVALLATLAVTVWRRSGGPSAQLIALGATAALMFAGIGWQRVGFGMENAASSRYVYMGAMLLAPGFALAVDRLAVLAAPALHAGRLLLVVAMLVNTGHLLVHATAWSKRSTCERTALSLLAGSPEAAAAADRSLQPLAFSPDVRLADLDRLVAEGAFRARVPADDTERSLVHAVLTVPSKTCLPT